MKLRARVVVTLVLGVVPLVGLVGWVQGELRRKGVVDATADAVLDRMNERERELCEANPRAWIARSRESRARGGPRGLGARGLPPRMELAVYDDSLRPAYAGAPPLEASIARELRAGTSTASSVVGLGRRARLVVATRMPWATGPCAVVVVRRPREGGDVRGVWLTAIAVAIAAIGVAVLAVGPLVRRIRKLTNAVASGQAVPTDGHDEITELARAFAGSRAEIRARLAELEARDVALTRFVANTTHDVMLPLTVLVGHLAELDERLGDGEAASAATVRAALEEAHYLTSLVQNLGVAAKLEAGEPHVVRHDVDLVALVERVMARHTRIAQQRRVQLAHAAPEQALVVHGDVTLIEQAVSNLVHNAVRYADAGGHVAVVLERSAPCRFELRVLDDGPGVPAELLSRLGERGFRTDEARTRQPQGFGLGLHIVHDVAERLGLELRFARAPEGGLSVTLSGECLAAVPPTDET
jgi:signal transduction histidine kinase